MRKRLFTAFVFLMAFAPTLRAQTFDAAQLREIRRYIKRSWTTLRRDNSTPIKSAVDPKVRPKVGQAGRLILYISPKENMARIASQLRRSLSPAQFSRVEIRALPEDPKEIKEHGLLYLPHPYVVPGGRFNEMYGWDSYFILLGLVRDGELPLARAMTDNLLYEIEHYGMVLNFNRTYSLNRSQPPFLTRMILEVYRRDGDSDWLERALPAVEQYYGFWTREPRLTPQTGLSRYYGDASGPAPEAVYGERDKEGKSHYDRVREYYRTHEVTGYDLDRYYDRRADKLTELFYIGDVATRESGFDPSARFGPFSVDIINYNPVDLNCLLYRMEMDTAAILTLLDRPREARAWAERGERRAITINRLMWNEKEGLYFDYNFEKQWQSDYPFITTFYPLWAGVASMEQAAKVVANLPIFERAGGLQTSARVTGNQWDAPFGWAPMHVIAVEGMRRYGFKAEADRVSRKFLAMILNDFAESGTIKEKYDVVTGKSDLAARLKFGYTTNEVGFGWTNAAFLLLAEKLLER
jgi:alpha,alpha-trehalase